MGLSNAMSTAITGLTSHQLAMDTIGNNLANVNTTGYKGYDYEFSTLFSQTLSSGTSASSDTGKGSVNPIQIGYGAQTGSTTQNFEQGSFDITGNPLDMALEGDGFFVLRQGNSEVYTRSGDFYIGDDNALLSGDGYYVQGTMAVNGVIPDEATTDDITIPIGSTTSGNQTSKASFTGNLDATNEIATGLKLISGGTVTSDAASYLGDTTVDDSWTALSSASTTGSAQMINGGTVQTSAAYAVLNPSYDPTNPTSSEYIAADINSDLSDLYYLTGNTWVKCYNGISDGDTITIEFEKGGEEFSVEFTYESGTSDTLEDFMTFLAGDVDNTATVGTIEDVQSTANTNLTGGIMGTIDVAGNCESGLYTSGSYSYDVPVETAGAFTRSYSGSVDYGNGNLADSFNISVVSNLGEDNAITGIEISYNSITYDDMFESDQDYGDIQGGGTTTTIPVYDSLGNEIDDTLTLSLVSQDSNFSVYRWVSSSMDDTDATWEVDPTTGEITTNSNTGTGIIVFDSNGNYVTGSERSESNGIEITQENKGVSSPITIDVINGLSTGTQDLDFSSMTFASLDAVFTLASQDGNAPGTLESFSVTTDGIIQGVYSNGVVEDIARMVVALIPNENGLLSAGDNIYYTSSSSGDAQIEYAGVGGRASVLDETLEMSNVDMSTELTDLISIQRGFQANSAVITTADEMLQELLSMK